MTSISDIKAVWLAQVFQASAVTAITPNVLDFEYTEDSQTEIERLYQLDSNGLGQINFFEYLVEIPVETIIEIGGQASPEKTYAVDVRYTKTLGPDGLAESEVKQAIETIKSTVRSQLGSTWSTLNVRTDLAVVTAPVAREEINGAPCVRQVVTFRAFKQ